MRLDLRLHGHIKDGRKCSADLSVYVKDEHEKEKVVMEASMTASWLLEEPGWPDVPEGSAIVVDSVESLHEKRQGKMIAPGVLAGSGPPGSFAAFLEQMGEMGAGEFTPGMFPEEDDDGP